MDNGKPKRKMMKFGSLFTGIGGFDLGFERAGMQCAWQVEIDENCQALLENRFPNAKRYTDVRTVKPRKLEPVDLICGGFPCQDLSVAGKRAGLAGERSGLWFEFHRIIKGTLPRWVVIENVPGLLSSNGGRDFAVILRGLVECGYGVAWRVLDAQHFGVPQRRRRVFVVASLGDGRCAEVLFERESGAGDSAESGEARARVAAPLTRGTSSGRGVNEPGRRREDDENLVAYTLPASGRHTGDGHGNAWNSNYLAAPRVARQGKGAFTDPVNDNIIAAPLKSEPPTRRNGGSDPIAGEFIVAPTLYASGAGTERTASAGNEADFCIAVVNGNSTPEIGEDCALPLRADDGSGNRQVMAFAWQQGDDSKFNESGKGRSYIARAGDYAGALSETRQDAVAFREQTDALFAAYGTKWNGNASADNGSLYAKSQFGVRRLTPTECERLQGFPDGYTEGFSDSVRYRMLGNAVAVPCANWIAKRIPQ